MLWYRSLINNKVRKGIILVLVVTFWVFIVINSFFIESFWKIQTYTFAVAAIGVITSIILYFIEILNSDRILQFERSIYFWFSLGVLVFWVPYMPLKFTSTYFNFQGPVYVISITVLNYLMYLFFIIGLLWSKKKYNY